MQHINRRLAMRSGLVLIGGALAAAMPSPGQANPMPEELRKALEHEGDAVVLGNPAGDITLTEFFDYNCPFCRETVPVLQRLILDDPQLRVVFREWPIFGEGSVFATKASLASLEQGKYWPFHIELMKIRGRVEEAPVLRAAEAVGLDMARLRRDMESARVLGHIEHSMALADHMGLAGTPTFIAGNDGLFGRQTSKDLQDLVTRARADLL
ncbi:DsbA family protein [Pseudogemmobacter humi]|uniref:Disulfide bond formation protein D n=1 Tax=Pseudogemmobacter humi TaxID=2483812 RepID=A0A3P5WCW8_9RHOB|nr:DsbA family protein [Pseudogemmobacter humi]VDC19062.1 Disulfide bond formation protein D precursor [Pseudogemmobacter humi]